MNELPSPQYPVHEWALRHYIGQCQNHDRQYYAQARWAFDQGDYASAIMWQHIARAASMTTRIMRGVV